MAEQLIQNQLLHRSVRAECQIDIFAWSLLPFIAVVRISFRPSIAAHLRAAGRRYNLTLSRQTLENDFYFSYSSSHPVQAIFETFGEGSGRGRMTFAAITPSTAPINVSQARAAKTDVEVSPLIANVTISVNA